MAAEEDGGAGMTPEATNLKLYACTCGCGRVEMVLCDREHERLAVLPMDMDAVVALLDMLADIAERHEAAAAAIGEVAGHA